MPRLYREVEAMRLRNQLDPKRFYRKDEGEGKGIKGLPKHFAVSIPHHEPSEQSILTVLPIFLDWYNCCRVDALRYCQWGKPLEKPTETNACG